MKKILLLSALAGMFVLSCKHNEGASNPYRDAKHHPSEEIAAGQKKASKQADHDFRKNQKRTKKSQVKKGNKWAKKKKQYR